MSKPVSKPRLVPRLRAALLLRTSVATLRRLEGKGELTRCLDQSGQVRYPRHEVDRLMRKRGLAIKELDNEQVARVFEMIRAGKSINDVVIETRFNAEAVERTFRRYHLGATFNPVEEVRQAKRVVDDEEQALHEEQIAMLDAELERRRRADREKAAEVDDMPEFDNAFDDKELVEKARTDQ